MMHLAEYRKRATLLADYLPWAGLVASGPTTIEGADCVAVSYPNFFAQLEDLTHES